MVGLVAVIARDSGRKGLRVAMLSCVVRRSGKLLTQLLPDYVLALDMHLQAIYGHLHHGSKQRRKVAN